MIAALGEDLPDAILLAEGLHLPDVVDRHTRFRCHLLRVSANRVTEGMHELRVVKQSDTAAVEHRGHRLRVADTRDRSLDDHAVETREYASDVVPIAFDQVRHRLTISPVTPSRTYLLVRGYAWVGKCASPTLLSKEPVELAGADATNSYHS
jgi:hypothetical protein